MMLLETASPIQLRFFFNKLFSLRVQRFQIADEKKMRLETALPREAKYFVNCFVKANKMGKKESYRHMLPHYQQPGQAYFVTWNLKDAVPAKALKTYSLKLESLKSQIRLYETQKTDQNKIILARLEYNLVRKKYIKAYDDLLDLERKPSINLSHPENTEIIKRTLMFWEGKKLTNLAFTIMPNHVHWVFQLFEKDSLGEPVYLQDIMHSVKLFSANKIHRMEQNEGPLWQKESFDTTIRDHKHMYFAIRYTINNPIKAGLALDWRSWHGTWLHHTLINDY